MKTTLDVAVQNAADAALVGVEAAPSALVALRISDGAVLAAANGPDGGTGENLAFNAQVPPGSTFKMVSALGLLDAGTVTASTVGRLPEDLHRRRPVVQELGQLRARQGAVPDRLRQVLQHRVRLAGARSSAPTGWPPPAGRSGLEGNWDLGIDAFTGKVSTGGSAAERAAAAFGQGTTLVSPLAMASATAAVAQGSVEQPNR